MSPHPLQSVLHLSGPLLAHLLVSAFCGARFGFFSAPFTQVHVILVTAGTPSPAQAHRGTPIAGPPSAAAATSPKAQLHRARGWRNRTKERSCPPRSLLFKDNTWKTVWQPLSLAFTRHFPFSLILLQRHGRYFRERNHFHLMHMGNCFVISFWILVSVSGATKIHMHFFKLITQNSRVTSCSSKGLRLTFSLQEGSSPCTAAALCSLLRGNSAVPREGESSQRRFRLLWSRVLHPNRVKALPVLADSQQRELAFH